jgi:hypothetical protein
MGKISRAVMDKIEEAQSREHENLVKMMATSFLNKKYRNVKAALSGWSNPDIIQGKKPDVTATRAEDNAFIILEAETCQSIVDPETGKQLKVFSDYAKQNGCILQLVVPANCGDETGEQIANRRIKELGISVDFIWWPDQKT